MADLYAVTNTRSSTLKTPGDNLNNLNTHFDISKPLLPGYHLPSVQLLRVLQCSGEFAVHLTGVEIKYISFYFALTRITVNCVKPQNPGDRLNPLFGKSLSKTHRKPKNTYSRRLDAGSGEPGPVLTFCRPVTKEDRLRHFGISSSCSAAGAAISHRLQGGD